MSTPDPTDVRAVRRAQRQAERAARAQRKADAARERALEAARAGGLFEGMEAMPRTAAEPAAAERGSARSTAAAPAAAGPAAADTTAAQPGTLKTAEAPGSAMTAAARPGADHPAAVVAAPARVRRTDDPKRRRLLTAALAAASVVLVVVAGVSTWQYVEARDDTVTEQLVADAPRAATEAAREVATQMFTYDHRTVDADLAAVRERLTDPALSEFVEQSMPTVASAAKQQQATVYATVAAAAPQEVRDPDHVTVLVMLNRMVSTKEAPEAASSASRLSLDMVRVDGTWKLGELEAL